MDRFKRFAKRDQDFPKLDERGNKVCRFCRKPIKKYVYCSDECREEVDIRCGFGIDYAIKKRDKCICYDCGLDCRELDCAVKEIRYLNSAYWWGRDSVIWKFLSENNFTGNRSWEIHHVIPVEEGGGCCGLENLITLCWRCHLNRHGSKVETPNKRVFTPRCQKILF